MITAHSWFLECIDIYANLTESSQSEILLSESAIL